MADTPAFHRSPPQAFEGMDLDHQADLFGTNHPDQAAMGASFTWLASYACHPRHTRGRRLAEPGASTRSQFQRDRDRILHAEAFRKLQYKTQVFVAHEGDYYRTRLTHSLEVAQIARSLSVALGLDQDLAEAIALAHDLGHTPFGHAGEDALNASLSALGQPKFNHNDQTLRIVTLLENRYADFRGLNLTWDTLEGIAKHNGPISGKLPETIANLNADWDLALNGYPSAEAQVAALADDIAYNNHDIDDAVRVGLLQLEDLAHLPLLQDIILSVAKRYPHASKEQRRHEVLRRAIDAMARDVLTTARKRLDALPAQSVEAIRSSHAPVVAFSHEMQEAIAALRRFLFTNVYRHYKVNRMRVKAMSVVQDLFGYYLEHPDCLPPHLAGPLSQADQSQACRLIIDHIAGMTDPQALREHQAVFDTHHMQPW